MFDLMREQPAGAFGVEWREGRTGLSDAMGLGEVGEVLTLVLISGAALRTRSRRVFVCPSYHKRHRRNMSLGRRGLKRMRDMKSDHVQP